MIVMVIRMILALLRRAGFNVPQLPTLRQRKFLIERLIDGDPAGGFGPGQWGGPGTTAGTRFSRTHAPNPSLGGRDDR